MSIGSLIIKIRLLQTLILNLKVKFMGMVIGQGYAVSPVSNWFTSFCFTSIWPTIHDTQLFEIWLWKIKGQDHGWGQSYIVHPASNQLEMKFPTDFSQNITR